MHRTQSHRSKAKNLRRRKGFMSSINRVSHLSRRAKRRLYCKLQLWMWRKRQERGCFRIFRARKRACVPWLSSKTQPQKNKRTVPVYHTLTLESSQTTTSVVEPLLGCDTEASDDMFRRQNCLVKPCESVGLSETFSASRSLQNQVMDTNAAARDIRETTAAATVPSQRTDTFVQFCEIVDPAQCSHTVKPLLSADSDACGGTAHFNVPRTVTLPQRLEVDKRSGQHATVSPGQDQTADSDTDDRMTSKTSDVSLRALTKDIQEFLDDFYRIYGSFIPLQKSDVWKHLKRKCNTDFSERKNVIFTEVAKYCAAILQKPVPSFGVVYKKHTLTLEDLSTLADQNWLNDQVMNMYGELIMESAHHKVHFLNSFFHRQLMTKGYDGVKRWTKQNILKYLMTEAREKQQTAFENGWTASFNEKIPQQTNENDCGVFVLEYSRCLALAKPLQFSQRDIPKIRKRIYKELCDCKLHEEG
uniref:uncharacterized protein LOC109974047 isoform X2 n=1 Tax=Monopterus albus TaxID=43700 RepID=UPI0009B3C45E|nr:uncharacterized protein LOC109974047 isoform X2 [Monopterus albus]